MKKIHRQRSALFAAFLLVVSLGLVACSDDTITSPTGSGTDEVTIDTVWQDARDELARELDDAALMEEIAPLLDQARADLDDTALKHGARLLLLYQTTTIEFDFEYPPPNVHLFIDFVGFGTVLGRHTGFADSISDVTVVPPTQTTVSYYTDYHGDQLDYGSVGLFEASADFTETTFWGDITFTGGSGRYEGASGNAQYYGTASNVEGTGRVLTWGWVNLDH